MKDMKLSPIHPGKILFLCYGNFIIVFKIGIVFFSDLNYIFLGFKL